MTGRARNCGFGRGRLLWLWPPSRARWRRLAGGLLPSPWLRWSSSPSRGPTRTCRCNSGPSLCSQSFIGSGLVSASPKGADGLAWDLAWDLAISPSRGHVVAGAAADLSKCYDGVRHPFLDRVLSAAGWPAALAGPLLFAYGVGRRVRVGEAVGAFRPPVSGIPAGCPLAVAVLAVVTWPWQAAVVAAGASAARRYVDDLTAWSRAPFPEPAVVAAALWCATDHFAAAAQLQLNVAKSGVFASTGPARRRLRRLCPGPPLLRTFKDLGAQQHVGVALATVLTSRASSTQGQLERLTGLPLPQRSRTLAVAGSGVQAGVFGLSLIHI